MNVVLLRHGESEWNLSKRFTGWSDIDLTVRGERQALEAGQILLESGYDFQHLYTSYLTRAIRSSWLALYALKKVWMPIHEDWRLNERHYGTLEGRLKAEVAREHGTRQVQEWRRSFTARPPAITLSDQRYAGKDPRYRNLKESEIPVTESLSDVYSRMLPCWERDIAPEVEAGGDVLIVAHGNTIRALIKHLESIDNSDLVNLNIPSAVPILYQLGSDLRPDRPSAPAGR